jgi:hypothetical protein
LCPYYLNAHRIQRFIQLVFDKTGNGDGPLSECRDAEEIKEEQTG